MRTIDDIIIHCSATPEGRAHTVDDLRRWHKEQGFADVGYHYIVYLDGSVHPGRSLERMGAHCKGHNAHSVGICYIGGMTADLLHAKDTRTPEQRTALSALVTLLRLRFPGAALHGHRDYAAKACPSFDVHTEM